MNLLTALQMTSEPDISANFEKVENILEKQLPDADEQLLVLPECFAYFGGRDRALLELAEQYAGGPIQSWLSQLAKQYHLWLVAGTIPIYFNQQQCCAASLVYNPDGKCVARYDKIHMFDVDVADGTKQYRESKTTHAGTSISRVQSAFGEMGQTVCYDLRFSGLFLNLSGCNIIPVPAAFTKVTGEAHWQHLLCARAIENQCYIVAANQTGAHANGRETFGHSMIVNPWGKVEAMLAEDQGLVSCAFDQNLLNNVRQNIPVMQHQKFRSEWI